MTDGTVLGLPRAVVTLPTKWNQRPHVEGVSYGNAAIQITALYSVKWLKVEPSDLNTSPFTSWTCLHSLDLAILLQPISLETYRPVSQCPQPVGYQTTISTHTAPTGQGKESILLLYPRPSSVNK